MKQLSSCKGAAFNRGQFHTGAPHVSKQRPRPPSRATECLITRYVSASTAHRQPRPRRPAQMRRRRKLRVLACLLTGARLRAAQWGAHSAPFGPQRAWGRAGCAARPSLPHPAASAGTRVRPPAGEAPPPVGHTHDGGTLPQPQTPRSEYLCSASRCKPLTFNEMKTCWDVDSWIDPTSRLQIGVEAAKH